MTGEGGAGKSRFLAALLAARSDVIVASARPGDGEVGLSTLVRLIEQLAERWPELRGGASYAQLLKLATGAGMHAQAEIRSALPLATDLLRRAHSCGLAGLVLDDLQFADDASADVWFAGWIAPP